MCICNMSQIKSIFRWNLYLIRSFYWRMLLHPLLLSLNVVFAIFFYLHVSRKWIILQISSSHNSIWQGIWMSGLGVALSSYAQLYIQCDFGDTLKSSVIIIKWWEKTIANSLPLCVHWQNSELMLKLQEMPWYMMSIKSQLAYAHLLNRLQNGVVLRMGPFAELSFETLSDVSRNIMNVQPPYSFSNI